MARLGERTSGADGQDGSEALQKSLLKVLTDLAQASTEVMYRRTLLGLRFHALQRPRFVVIYVRAVRPSFRISGRFSFVLRKYQ